VPGVAVSGLGTTAGHRPEEVARSRLPSSPTTGTGHRRDDVERPLFPLSAPASRIEPVAPRSFRVHFTASAELRDKLERLQALMRSSVPDGDLGRIIEQAVTEKLERPEAKRFGEARKPRKRLSQTDTRPRSRHIPAAVRRAVEKRDGGRCTYRNEDGRRCTRRHDLEFHHREPYGFGGDHSPENLALMCRTHNNLMAEQDYGREVMWRHRRPSSSPRPDRTPDGPVSRRRGHG
jgi:5-methylcytosine-specific restriction endonuclease McrA